MKVLATCLTLLSIAAAGGADEKEGFPARPASSYKNRQTIAGLTIAAEVFDTREEIKSAFGKLDPTKYGVLPVLVVMQNDSGKALRLDSARFEYVRPDRRRLQAVPAGEVQYLYGVKKPQTVPAPRYPLPGLGGKSKNPLAAWEIEGRAFAAKMLPPGDAASGFVYFQTANHRGAVLYVTGVTEAASGQELFYFEIPLD
jgi:hypothetical protein